MAYSAVRQLESPSKNLRIRGVYSIQTVLDSLSPSICLAVTLAKMFCEGLFCDWHRSSSEVPKFVLSSLSNSRNVRGVLRPCHPGRRPKGECSGQCPGISAG
eukprot:4556116-Amphidinium_carterae.1